MPKVDIMMMVVRLSILVFAVVMHEVAHGYVAYLLGDPTAKNAKRLDLNPIHHIDPFGSILLPLILSMSGLGVVVGYAKPVPINPSYFKKPRRDSVLVSLAGVTANFLIAIAAAVMFRTLRLGMDHIISIFLMQMCLINVALGLFNLIPLPPLDGSHVLAAILPPYLAEKFMTISRYGIIIIVVLFWILPFGSYLFAAILMVAFKLLGLPLF